MEGKETRAKYTSYQSKHFPAILKNQTEMYSMLCQRSSGGANKNPTCTEKNIFFEKYSLVFFA